MVQGIPTIDKGFTGKEEMDGSVFTIATKAKMMHQDFRKLYFSSMLNVFLTEFVLLRTTPSGCVERKTY